MSVLILCGAAGASTSVGTPARDVLKGTAANDVLSGKGGNDRLYGRSGRDRIDGGPGNDLVAGGSGADRLVGGAGKDLFQGGADNDVISARDGARDRIACGRGTDRVTRDKLDVVTVDCELVSTTGSRLDKRYGLTVVVKGQGAVTSTPAGISCGADCAETYVSGSNVTLKAQAANGWKFDAWSGACTGSNQCAVTLSTATTVTATFIQAGSGSGSGSAGGSSGSGGGTATGGSHRLAVTKTGQGTVSSTPAGITCGSDCEQDYAAGTAVALSAAAQTGWAFSGWSGACSGGGACSVTMTDAKSVSATFVPTRNLSVSVSIQGLPLGSGRVTSSPAGIDCTDSGGDCNEAYADGTVVTLTATSQGLIGFIGWSGACTGTQTTCNVTMGSDQQVSALFGP